MYDVKKCTMRKRLNYSRNSGNLWHLNEISTSTGITMEGTLYPL